MWSHKGLKSFAQLRRNYCRLHIKDCQGLATTKLESNSAKELLALLEHFKIRIIFKIIIIRIVFWIILFRNSLQTNRLPQYSLSMIRVSIWIEYLKKWIPEKDMSLKIEMLEVACIIETNTFINYVTVNNGLRCYTVKMWHWHRFTGLIWLVVRATNQLESWVCVFFWNVKKVNRRSEGFQIKRVRIATKKRNEAPQTEHSARLLSIWCWFRTKGHKHRTKFRISNR